MRILISISHLRIGGAQQFILRLAEGLADKQHQVYLYDYELLSHQSLNSLVSQIPQNINLITHPSLLDKITAKIDRQLAKVNIKSNFWLWSKKLHFKFLIFFLKIDLVLTALYHSDKFVTQTLQQTKVPIILRSGGDYRFVIEEGNSTQDEVLQIMNRVNGIICVCESDSDVVSKYTSNSQALRKKIYNGIIPPKPISREDNPRQKLNISKDAFIFGMVARGIPEKGWAEAIKSFELLQGLTEQDIHLILVGDSEYLLSLKQSLNSQLQSIVHFVGYSSEPEYWIDSFNVGLLPTYFSGESLPNSVVEYLAFGKPTIATNIAGLPEMINYEGQEAGFLVDLNQYGRANVALMQNAMLKYLRDYCLFQKHSELALKAFAKFNISISINSYEEFFQEFSKM